MNQKELNKIWELYKQFCMYASQTQDVQTGDATDFLGWLELHNTALKDVKSECNVK